MTTKQTLIALAFFGTLATTAHAECLTDAQAADLVASYTLDHPLNVVWLAGALAREGLALQPGDLVSLGSFSPLLPPRAGLSVTATYGLPGAAPVRLSFKSIIHPSAHAALASIPETLTID